MKLRMKQKVQSGFSLILICMMVFLCMPVSAEDAESLENKTNELQNELDDINQDLLAISDEIASTEAEIEDANNEMLRLQDSLAISRENEARQYENMKTRIKYMYENGNSSLLQMMFSAESMSDFLNRADFVQNITEYDRDMLTTLQDMKTGIEEQESALTERQDALADLQTQLEEQQDELTAKAEETSTDLAAFNKQLQAIREEEARKAEEARLAEEARQKEEEARKTAAANAAASTSGNNTSSGSTSSGNSSSGSSSAGGSGSNNSSQGSNSGYTYPSGSGVLSPEKGVVYFNGHRETYYSQKVLPGGGLNIPGRHVASDGTIRDADGYICVASSDLPWGTIVETSLGTGKVYDSGCASGTIDIYTDW